MIALAIAIFFFISLCAILAIRLVGSNGFFTKRRFIQERVAGTSLVFTENSVLKKKNYFSDIQIIDRFLNQFGFAKEISENLKITPYKISVSAFFLLSICISIFVFFFLRRMMPYSGSLVLAFISSTIPFIYLRLIRQRYLKKFEEYFPNALSIISGSLKVGHVLEAGINAVAATAPYPINEEFKMVQGELKLGVGLQTALENLYKRIKNEELKIFITGVIINQELGGNLSEVLDNIEKTIRERFALNREIKALSGQGKMSAIVLFFIPIIISFMTYKSNPKTFLNFFTSPIGMLAIWFMGFMALISYLGIRKVINIKD